MVRYDDELLNIHLQQARSALPGPDYYEVLRWIHQCLRPDTYVDIGVRQGGSLTVALPGTKCVAIDPAPAISVAIPEKTSLFALTSNAFFAQHDLSAVLGSAHVSLGFIDGLHLFEQALQDFINLERFAGPTSVLMVHDCLPLDALTSARQRTTHFYSGDVWKLAACLKQCRPELRMRTVRTAPTGLCLVAGLDAGSDVLRSRYDEVVSAYSRLTFADYVDRPELMPFTIDNSREAVVNFLTGALAHSESAGRECVSS